MINKTRRQDAMTDKDFTSKGTTGYLLKDYFRHYGSEWISGVVTLCSESPEKSGWEYWECDIDKLSGFTKQALDLLKQCNSQKIDFVHWRLFFDYYDRPDYEAISIGFDFPVGEKKSKVVMTIRISRTKSDGRVTYSAKQPVYDEERWLVVSYKTWICTQSLKAFLWYMNQPFENDELLPVDFGHERQVDPLYQAARDYVLSQERITIPKLQIALSVSFPKAKSLLALLQKEGVVQTELDSPRSARGYKVIRKEG
jgi:hypothetical protein